MDRIVVGADPVGVLAVGEILDTRAAIAAQGKRVPLLPVDAAAYYRPDGCSARREFSPPWQYDGGRNERGCPLLVVLSPDVRYLYWAACIVPLRAGEPFAGTFRAALQGIGGTVIGGVSQETRPEDLARYVPGPRGGLIVMGRNRVGVHSVAPGSVMLHGLARNAGVKWFAVSGGADSEDIPNAVAY